MDQLTQAAIDRARAALASVGGDVTESRLFAHLLCARIQARLEYAKTGTIDVAGVAERMFGTDRRLRPVVEYAKSIKSIRTKAGVATGATSSGSWGSEVYDPAKLTTAFGVAITRAGVLERCGAQLVPFDVPLSGALAHASLGFVSEASEIPAVAMTAITPVILKQVKVAGLGVISNTLAADPEAVPMIERDLVRVAVVSRDRLPLDPTITASGDLPASLTSSLTPIAGGAVSTVAALDTLLRTAISELATAGSDMVGAKWILSPLLAAEIASLRATGGGIAYADIGANGGSLLGIEALTTPGSPAGQIFLVDGAEVWYAAAPEVEVTLGRETVVDQDNAPPGTKISMFSTDSTAIRIISRVNWAWRRTFGAVITGLTIS